MGRFFFQMSPTDRKRERVCVCVRRCNRTSVHLQWVGRRSQTKKEICLFQFQSYQLLNSLWSALLKEHVEQVYNFYSTSHIAPLFTKSSLLTFYLLLRSSLCHISRNFFAPFSGLVFRNKLQKVFCALKTTFISQFLPILSYLAQTLFTWINNIEQRSFSSFFGRIIPRNLLGF